MEPGMDHVLPSVSSGTPKARLHLAFKKGKSSRIIVVLKLMLLYVVFGDLEVSEKKTSHNHLEYLQNNIEVKFLNLRLTRAKTFVHWKKRIYFTHRPSLFGGIVLRIPPFLQLHAIVGKGLRSHRKGTWQWENPTINLQMYLLWQKVVSFRCHARFQVSKWRWMASWVSILWAHQMVAPNYSNFQISRRIFFAKLLAIYP